MEIPWKYFSLGMPLSNLTCRRFLCRFREADPSFDLVGLEGGEEDVRVNKIPCLENFCGIGKWNYCALRGNIRAKK